MRRRVYLSMPLSTLPDRWYYKLPWIGAVLRFVGVWRNMRRARAVASELMDRGYAVFCPHLSWYLDPFTATRWAKWSHAEWLEAEKPWIAVADALFVAGGASRGGASEVNAARYWYRPIFRDIDEMDNCFGIDTDS